MCIEYDTDGIMCFWYYRTVWRTPWGTMSRDALTCSSLILPMVTSSWRSPSWIYQMLHSQLVPSLLILKSVNINNCNSSEYADLDYHLSLKCTVQVTDNGYPNPQSDTATAIITIDRDLNVPVFTSNARYAVTIDETTNIGSSILNVQASRLNLVVFTLSL